MKILAFDRLQFENCREALANQFMIGSERHMPFSTDHELIWVLKLTDQ